MTITGYLRVPSHGSIHLVTPGCPHFHANSSCTLGGVWCEWFPQDLCVRSLVLSVVMLKGGWSFKSWDLSERNLDHWWEWGEGASLRRDLCSSHGTLVISQGSELLQTERA